MGCAASSNHRQIGLRHDPFHNSIYPSVGEQGVWLAPSFQNEYRHTMDLSTFMSQEPSAPPHVLEDPPPYTEQLLEGHVTLMYGGKQEGNKDETDELDGNPLNADHDMQDRSIQSADAYSEEYAIAEALSMSRQLEYDSREMHVECEPEIFATSDDYTDDNIDVQSHSGVLVRSSTPTRATRPPPNIAERDPFYDIPNLSAHAPTRQLFQRPARSHSIDNSSIYLSRDHPTTDSIPESLPDSSQRLGPPSSPFQQEPGGIPPRLRPLEQTPNNPFLRPARLPPLRTSASTQQHKRAKRKRGHSWHGGVIPREQNFVNTSSMATVAE